MPIGAGPAARNLSSNGADPSSTCRALSSKSGKPLVCVCAGQSVCRGANQSGQAPMTRSGECIQRLSTRCTGARPRPARTRFRRGATRGSISSRSVADCRARKAQTGSHDRSPIPGSTDGRIADGRQMGDRCTVAAGSPLCSCSKRKPQESVLPTSTVSRGRLTDAVTANASSRCFINSSIRTRAPRRECQSSDLHPVQQALEIARRYRAERRERDAGPADARLEVG